METPQTHNAAEIPIGKVIEGYLTKNHIRHSDFAKKVGISSVTLSRTINQHTAVRPQTWEKIKAAYRQPYDTSFTDDASVAERAGMRTVRLEFRSTAENLAREFYRRLQARIPHLHSVKVFETPGSNAEYSGRD